ncbi:MAG: DUF3458 domain-containing protein [Deltaproteobacteria bacterium]|nr:DUF3458 domain-containing protein [Deltaproteobacteria bacterium]
MSDRTFKYRREDFGDLPVTLDHLTIRLSFFEDRVEAENCLELTAKTEMDEIVLDADGLDLLRVDLVHEPHDPQGTPLRYQYHKEDRKLSVRLPKPYVSGERFLIRTVCRSYPSESLLEGIYRDATPPGAPQQYMSQCQQWGFQRIMPILDDCRAKCTMTTTMQADSAYTHLISNGDVCLRTNPDRRPVPKENDPGRQVITYENKTPMAPYLFIAAVGTWDELSDEVVYPSGRRVRLEYLAPPGRTKDARIPMDILKDAILWTGRTQEYEYTGDAYRTICMNKSNFGGMENVGNTTIVTDAALIDEHTMDAFVLYAHAVIVHEFEHNQCGSETTMDTPFDVWLNEAYTVDVERQYSADVFDASFVRLRQVDSIRDPLLGPLAIEDGGHLGKVVREGFNDPEELIDGVTYVKAAEVIRMLRLLLGTDLFKAGKRLYFSRYRHANATTDQFFRSFEEVSGASLESFKRTWLYTIGYPKVTAHTSFDPVSKSARIRFRQERPDGVHPFHLPIELALVDAEGNDIEGTRQVFELNQEESELVFEDLSTPPAFASLNRDYSFYGTFHHENATFPMLTLQARLDPNPFNRIEAFRRSTDSRRKRLLLDANAAIDTEWLDVYGEILADRNLPPALKAYFLKIDEQPMDRRYVAWPQELVAARERLMRAVNERFRTRLLECFHGLNTYGPRESPKDGIEERMLKAVLLELIAVDDTRDSHRLILDHYRAATTANDRVTALGTLNRTSAEERRPIIEAAYELWHPHLTGYGNYLRIVSSGTQPDVFDMIEREKTRESFDITQPTWCRALFLPMAANSKMLWTDYGIRWLADKVIELASVNATTAGRMLNSFQLVRDLKPLLKEPVLRALELIVGRVPDTVSPAIHGQARSYLKGA